MLNLGNFSAIDCKGCKLRIVTTFLINSVSLAVRLGANFALNKILAVLIGPASFALIGQFQNFLVLLQNATSGLLVNGVTKLTVQAKGDPVQEHKIWSTALSAILVLSLLAAVIIFFTRGWLSNVLIGDAGYSYLLVLAGVTATSFGLSILIATIFASKSDMPAFTTMNIGISLINLIVIGLGTYYYTLEGALMATAISQSLPLIIGIILLQQRSWYGFRLSRPFFDRKISKQLAKYGLMAIVATGALAIGQIIVRSQIIAEFGLTTAGIYEALWRLSAINQLIFSSTLLVYALPELSRVAGTRAFGSFYRKAILAASLLAAFLFVGEYLIRGPLFRLLFSSEFEPAIAYFGFQAAGDVARVVTAITGIAIIALSRPGLYIALEILRFFIFVSASACLLRSYGSGGAAVAYFLSYGLSALVGVAMLAISQNGRNDRSVQETTKIIIGEIES
jgi:polysaccharide transporter, PST family